MQIGSLGKLIVAVVVVVCLTVLMALGSIEANVGMGPITLIAGYVIGNGFASKKGDGVQSIIEPKVVPVK